MNTSIATGPPEPVYRWVIVIASAVMLAVAMGMMVNGISAFFIPLNEEFGWQRGAVSAINLAGLMGLSVGGVVMGRLADQTNTKNVCLLGATVLGICVLSSAWANELWQFYSLYFVGGFLGAGALFSPLMANVGNWFKAAPGLAIGIASAGQALGQGAVPFGSALLIGAVGWRDALTILGIVMLATLIPLAMLIRQPPKRRASQTSAVSAERFSEEDKKSPIPIASNITIAWLSIAVIFCCICMSVPLIHLVPLIQDNGFALEEAGSVIFVMFLVAITGRIFFGFVADKIGAIQAYMIASAWQTLLVFGFTQIEALNSFYIFAVVYGFGYAGVMTGLLVCVRVLTPLSRRASALGIVGMFGWIGHAIGGYQGGFFFDLTQNYTLTYANAAFAGIINLIIVGSLLITINRRKLALANSPLKPAQ